MVLGSFGEAPDDPRELAVASIEAEWLERRRAEILVDVLIARLFGKGGSR